MKQRKRIYYTPEQKALIWDRYKQGDSLHDIARMFDPTILRSCQPFIKQADIGHQQDNVIDFL